MADRSFPFVPRRSSALVAGDFWSISLSNGRYACGRVLGHIGRSEPRSTVTFIAGLLDWTSDQPPDAAAIAGAAVANIGHVHVATISDGGGAVVGHRELGLDGIKCPTTVSSYWGDGYARGRAEHLFVNGNPPPQFERREVASPLTDEMLRPIVSLSSFSKSRIGAVSSITAPSLADGTGYRGFRA